MTLHPMVQMSALLVRMLEKMLEKINIYVLFPPFQVNWTVTKHRTSVWMTLH